MSPLTPIDEIRRGLQDRDRQKLDKAIRGLQIKVTHRGEVRRKFKISKLTLTPANRTTFTKGTELVDVAAYFYQTYGRRLTYPDLPCVVAGRDIYLPMEVCFVVEVS